MGSWSVAEVVEVVEASPGGNRPISENSIMESTRSVSLGSSNPTLNYSCAQFIVQALHPRSQRGSCQCQPTWGRVSCIIQVM